MKSIKKLFHDLKQYPSAIAGLAIIIFLLGVAAYTVVALPYSEAVRKWRGGEEVWAEYPKNARPAWFNYFTRTKLAESIILDSAKDQAEKTEETRGANKDIFITYTFDYTFDKFPNDLIVYLKADYVDKQPHVSMTWYTPDGREISVGEISSRRNETFRISQDSRLQRRLERLTGINNVQAHQGLFDNPEMEGLQPLEGEYKLVVNGLMFSPNDELNAKFVLHGELFGVAGTDHRRRDLTIALLWGTPIALAFGLLAALGTTITTMFIAGVGVWFGGIVDEAIQRITEVNLVLPVLPILIMVGTFYSRSIWLILGVVVLLSIFGSGIKTYRAIFLQVRESPYIEAARAYGASNWRIIIHYLIPRIIPLLIPQLVVLIPSFVFLEASLAVLGLGDPVLPTWGKIIDDANSQGALYNGNYYWVLEPAILLMVTGFAFAMVGFALDRIFNPRLRGL